MKRSKYAEINGLKTEKDWTDHFANNLKLGSGAVCMVSCPVCDEILLNKFYKCTICGHGGKVSGTIKVNIEDIFEIEERRRNINKLDFADIEFCSDGKPLNIDPKIREEFAFIGLNNIDFITSNYYLRKFDE